MVWRRQGEWHLNGSGTAVRLGEAMPPGGLLTASRSASPHSLIVLLPDGQLMLCECYRAQTCAQGFRIPAIATPPAPAVGEMFAAVRNVLLLEPATAESAFSALSGRDAMAHFSEITAALTPRGEISLAPALRDLPSGTYSYTIRPALANGEPEGSRGARPAARLLDWNAPQGVASVPVAGIEAYRIQVRDWARVLRLDIVALAAPPGSVAAESARLHAARQTVLQWSRANIGWPAHDFLRVYLAARASALQAESRQSSAGF
jgi:hypothetical protein